jgi:hypothetical protein
MVDIEFSRRTCLRALPALLAAAAESPLAASVPAPANPRSMIRLFVPGHSRPRATLKNLAWLQGHWTGRMPNAIVDNVIFAPIAGQMPTFVRATQDGNIVFYEMTAFVENEGSLTIREKHFTPDFAGWEPQQTFVDRPLVAYEAHIYYFDGTTFVKTGPDSYTVYHLNRSGQQEEDTIVVPFRRASIVGL